MKINIRDGIAELGMALCRFADRTTQQAKEHAFNGLDGNQEEIIAAREARAMAAAYMEAVNQVDALRIALERGDYAT